MADILRWYGEQVKALVRLKAERIERQAANYLATKAREFAPVDTGALRNSIIVVRGPSAHTITCTVEYGGYVEWGHMAGGVTWVPPNPFMRKAIAATVLKFPSFVAFARF